MKSDSSVRKHNKHQLQTVLRAHFPYSYINMEHYSRTSLLTDKFVHDRGVMSETERVRHSVLAI